MANINNQIAERLLLLESPTKGDLDHLKIEISRDQRLKGIPKNSEILRGLEPEVRARLIGILRRKAVRSISGVNVVAVMTRPSGCPHGTCSYCPGGPLNKSPQSYTGYEPAAMRGKQNEFDSYRQVKGRISQLKEIGHDADKIELIVMGGTFTATVGDYQERFIKGCLDAITDEPSTSLAEAKSNAEKSKIRNVGITVETRPDWAKEEHIVRMLDYGATKVELGVQILDNEIYALINRCHTVQDVVDATQRLKDSGLKICYHIMPGLPGSNFQKDLESFRHIIADPKFRPDMFKLYPCLVIQGTEIYRWWTEGKYTPYGTEQAVTILAEMKKLIPPWIRVMRIQRDIPANLIVAGVKKSNIRELVHASLASEGAQCRCIRCREIGHRELKDHIETSPETVAIFETPYEASGGQEIFISTEDRGNDTLVGYLRLRIPSEYVYKPEIRASKSALVRELHVYGPLVQVGAHSDNAWQHKGYGAKLLAHAEKVARENFDCRKMLVTSALGTKQYYAKFGYTDDGPYVSKRLD